MAAIKELSSQRIQKHLKDYWLKLGTLHYWA